MFLKSILLNLYNLNQLYMFHAIGLRFHCVTMLLNLWTWLVIEDGCGFIHCHCICAAGCLPIQPLHYAGVSEENGCESGQNGASAPGSTAWSRISTPDSLEWDPVEAPLATASERPLEELDAETEQLLSEIERLTSRALRETGDWSSWSPWLPSWAIISWASRCSGQPNVKIVQLFIVADSNVCMLFMKALCFHTGIFWFQ